MTAPAVQCPVCGATEGITTTTRTKHGGTTVLGVRYTYEGIDNHCSGCGETGDFDAADTPTILAAIKEADRKAMAHKLQHFVDRGISYPAIERILRIPQGSLKRWTEEGPTPEAAALIAVLTPKNLLGLDL